MNRIAAVRYIRRSFPFLACIRRARSPKSKSKVAIYLHKHIAAISYKKSQREIAQEVGWTRPNMISMIKSGDAKVPWGSVSALAKAIEADPADLFRLALEEYWPEAHDAIGRVFGSIVSENERSFLEHLRAILGDPLPPLSEDIKTSL